MPKWRENASKLFELSALFLPLYFIEHLFTKYTGQSFSNVQSASKFSCVKLLGPTKAGASYMGRAKVQHKKTGSNQSLVELLGPFEVFMGSRRTLSFHKTFWSSMVFSNVEVWNSEFMGKTYSENNQNTLPPQNTIQKIQCIDSVFSLTEQKSWK